MNNNKIRTLKKNYEFKNILNKGKYFVKKQIIVYITKNKKNENYIGIGISTKLCHAVQRNRLKRLIRENYRLINSNIDKGYDIVFLWNKKVKPEEADFNTIKIDMESAFKEANILKENNN